jgi:RNA polymerase sigma-70 factor (ECF subfamily)
VLIVNPTFVEIELVESPSLVSEARAGDHEAFGTLCRIHGNRLLRQATALCGDATLAEDLAQETLLEAWKSLRRYNGKCQFFTWLCAILVHRHRSVLRQRRPFPTSSLNGCEQEYVAGILANLSDKAAPPDQAAALAERATLLRHSMNQLSPRHREVVYLRFYVDDSLEGIAAALGCSVGTIKSRLFHAVERLRAMRSISGGLNESPIE